MKIISGGQTGADRTALDWAIAHGVEHGGWCPEGRRAEDGVIPMHYQVIELAGAGYRARTKANVRASDGTLIISIAPILSGGSLLTLDFATAFEKPCLHVHPDMGWRDALEGWLEVNTVHVLNVAGPRLSSEPRIVAFTGEVLDFLYFIISRDPCGDN
jgi:hypothetical protein